MSTVHSTGARPSRMMLAWRWLSVLMLVLPLVLTPAAQAAPIALSVHAQETPPTSSTLALEANLPGNSDPVLTEEERLWQQIEAATNAGDRAALPALIQELARFDPVSYTHLRAHETVLDIVCRLLLEKKKKNTHY